MKYQYTNPDAAGCLLEADACAQVIRELERLETKYKRQIDREMGKRRKELESAMEYLSVDEIHEAYGYEMITEEQYQRYTKLFEQGEAALEDHAPTKAERVRQILISVRSDILRERQEWEFSALSPEEQVKELKRRDEVAAAWKKKLKALKEQMGQGKEIEAAQMGET